MTLNKDNTGLTYNFDNGAESTDLLHASDKIGKPVDKAMYSIKKDGKNNIACFTC